jgi:ceramide glucosyltransferase
MVDAGSVVRVLVAEGADGAWPVGEAACGALRAMGLEASVVVTGACGPNRKADQLARALTTERDGPAIVVVADSDVLLDHSSLAGIVAPILAGACDAAWAPPVESAPQTPADRASQSVLGGSLHAFALLAGLDPRGMVGKLFAVRRSSLERVGGLAPLTDYLGEDMELARRLRAAGLRVAVGAAPAASLAAGRSWEQVVRRYARWLAVIRAQRPALLLSYPLLLAAAPLQLGLACIAVACEGARALPCVLGVVALRGLVTAAARHRSRSPGGPWWASWAADAVLLVAFARAVTSRSVDWRGAVLRFDADRIATGAPR